MNVLIAIRVVKRQAQRVGRACVPIVDRAVSVVLEMTDVRVGGERRTITRHAALAAVGAGVFATAECFAGPGVAELLKLGSALTIGAIAVSAGIHIARRHAENRPARVIIRGAATAVTPKHRGLLAATVLRWLCEPGSIGQLVRADAAALIRMVITCGRLLLGAGARAVPLLGTALEVAGAYEVTLASALFVSDFEATALALCAESTPYWTAAAIKAATPGAVA